MSGVKVFRLTTVNREGLETIVTQEDSIGMPVEDYIENLLEGELETGLPVEFSRHHVPKRVADRFLIEDDEWAASELVDYCLGLEGGIDAAATRLHHRMIFITWNSKQVELLTSRGLLKNPSPVPEEYRLEELKRDMLIVNSVMQETQSLEVTFKDEAGIRILNCKDGKIEEKELH